MKLNRKQYMLMVAILGVVMGLAGITWAAESSSGDDWKFVAEAYLWGASIGGQTAAGSDVDIDFDDLFDDLEMAFMGAFGAKKGRWAILADVIYLDVKDEERIDGVDTSVELTGWILTPAVGYNLLDTERGNLNLLAGARYLYLDADLRLGTARVDDSGDVWDGIIGIRGNLNLSEKWYLSYHLDIGTGDTDMTWQALAGIGFRFDRFDVVAGYRYLDWDFDDSDVFDDLNLSGPMAGVKFRF